MDFSYKIRENVFPPPPTITREVKNAELAPGIQRISVEVGIQAKGYYWKTTAVGRGRSFEEYHRRWPWSPTSPCTPLSSPTPTNTLPNFLSLRVNLASRFLRQWLPTHCYSESASKILGQMEDDNGKFNRQWRTQACGCPGPTRWNTLFGFPPRPIHICLTILIVCVDAVWMSGSLPCSPISLHATVYMPLCRENLKLNKTYFSLHVTVYRPVFGVNLKLRKPTCKGRYY